MRPTFAVGAAAVTMALLVGACGSSSRTGSGSTASPASTAAGAPATTGSSGGAATGTPIKVGEMCTCSGPFGGDLVANSNIYKAWASTVNDSGGINGHPIQVIYEDDGGNPGTSVTDLKTLINDHVVAVVDNSLVDEPWAPTIEAANIPVVGGDLAAIPFGTNPDFYPEGQTNGSVTYANVATAKAAGATNLGLLYCSEAANCAQGIPLVKAAAQQLGLTTAYTGAISATAPNYTAQCVAAKQAHVQAMIILDVAAVITKVATDCAQQGFNPAYVSEGTGFTNQLSSTPALKDSLYAEFPTLPYFSTSSAVQKMNTALDKYYPGLRSNDEIFSGGAVQSWPAGLLFQAAVKASGIAGTAAPTSADLIKGLESLKGETLDGWAPPLTFTAGKPHIVNCWLTTRVQGGTPTILNNGKLTCDPGATS